MSTVSFRRTKERSGGSQPAAAPLLFNGDRLSQSEFHRRYLAYPDDTKFELIGGVVYMASPMRLPHSGQDRELTTILNLYRAATPGVESAPNATVILGDDEEPQPDHLLRILPEYGGQSRTTEGQYIAGPPEFIAEVAHSTVAIDLHGKKSDYRRCGVREYIVVCLEEQAVVWFDLTRDRELSIPKDGVLKSREFPGLWIDTSALLSNDVRRLVAVLEQGLATEEHARFTARLAAAGPKVEAEADKPRKARSRTRGKRK